MSETDVKKDTQDTQDAQANEESDQKKVTFSEEKDTDKQNKEDEEVDEEGRKSRGSRTGSGRSRTSSSGIQNNVNTHLKEDESSANNFSECEESDAEETQKDVADVKTDTKAELNSNISDKDEVKSVDSSKSSNESYRQHLTDDEKEVISKTSTNSTPRDEEVISHDNATPSKFSLNSRPVNRDVQQDYKAHDSGNEDDTAEETFVTDDEKLAQSKPSDTKEDKQSVKSEESVLKEPERKISSNEDNNDMDKSKQTHVQEKKQSNDEASTPEEKKDKSQDKTVQAEPEDTESKPVQIKIVEKPKPNLTPKEKEQDSPPTKPQRDRPWAVQSKQPPTKTQKEPERSMSPRQLTERDKIENKRKTQSARYPSTRYSSMSHDTSTRASSRTSSRWSRPPSRPRTCGYISEERRRKEKEFFYAELNRLKDSLKKESKKIKKPKVRDHYPDVFTSLEPYYNTYTADYLINMPDMGYKAVQHADERAVDEDSLQYTTRCTAIGLTDPWDSLNMDRSVLPKIETSEMRKKRMDQVHAEPKRKSTTLRKNRPSTCPTPKAKRPEAKQGSTRLPKFPVIQPPNSELTTKELHYGDVPMLRNEFSKFSHNGDSKKKSDYTRTKQDFYRMELDRLDEYHVVSRPHMRAAYFAYLQNTPGSRKAVYDCVKELNGGKKKEPMAPQAVA